MDNNKQHDDFQSLWERRKHLWQEKAAATVPDDATVLRMADYAGRQAATSESAAIPLNSEHCQRRLPCVTVASIETGHFFYDDRDECNNMLPHIKKDISMGGFNNH